MRLRSALLVPTFAVACLAVLSPCRGEDTAATKPAGPAPFELRDGDRVIFLGATLIEREQKYGYWETILTARFPDRNVTFRNLGWDGDTVWAESRGIFDPPAAGYARMIEQIKGLKPTVLFLAYGNNESFAGPEGVDPFIKQYEKLIDDLTKVSADGVRFVILMPVRAQKIYRQRFDPHALNEKLTPYSIAIGELCKRRGIRAVDLNDDLFSTGPSESKRMINSFRLVDGMHWSGPGYEHLAILLRKELGLNASFSFVIDQTGKVEQSNGVAISDVSAKDDSFSFTVTPDRIPIHASLFPLKISPQFNGLTPGKWQLNVDGVQVAAGDPIQWQTRSYGIPDTGSKRVLPSDVEKLREAIVAKNELYFHSWRPQNVTYLFGFRKHEQGQNAKETAEFEKLVAEKEAEIAKLRKPVAYKYELIRQK